MSSLTLACRYGGYIVQMMLYLMVSQVPEIAHIPVYSMPECAMLDYKMP